jgi:hypothetical protein
VELIAGPMDLEAVAEARFRVRAVQWPACLVPRSQKKIDPTEWTNAGSETVALKLGGRWSSEEAY